MLMDIDGQLIERRAVPLQNIFAPLQEWRDDRLTWNCSDYGDIEFYRCSFIQSLAAKLAILANKSEFYRVAVDMDIHGYIHGYIQGCRGYEISHPYPYPYPQILRGYPWIYPYP